MRLRNLSSWLIHVMALSLKQLRSISARAFLSFVLEPQPFLNPRPVARLPRMSKRPHADVDATDEGLDQQVYTGGMGTRRRAVAAHLQAMGLPSAVVLPWPVHSQPSHAGLVTPGEEALQLASLATVVHTFQFPSALAAGGAAAMQDDTASGQDTAPVPNPGTASRQEAAPAPNRDTASGQGELELQPGSAHDGSASAQIGRDPLSRDIGDEDVHQGVEMPREEAPPQERSYPQNRQVRDKKGHHWRLDNVWQVWMWWNPSERNWMWQDVDGQWYPNWQPRWSSRNDGERNWSARGTWHESSWGSMEE